jgi:hypothetical protein
VRPAFHVDPPLPRRPRPLCPTTLHYKQETDGYETCLRWLATVWPGGRHAWFAAGVSRIAGNIDWWEAEWRNRVFLEALLEPDTDLGEPGRRLLGLGLGAKEPGEAGVAVDALIRGIEDGRLSAESLGTALTELAATGLIKPPRWARTLAEGARASALHSAVARGALERLLSAAPDWRPADLGAVLELLLELCAQAGAGVTDPAARAYLAAQTGGGKAAKLAATLLARAAPDGGVEAGAALALLGRLERAERWAAVADS